MMWRTGVVTVVALLMGVGAAWAQNPPPAVPAPPVNIVVPNYNGVAAGQIASLEANAFLARANDSSSAYFNPAGLARASQTSVSGSAGVFQIASVRPDGLNSEGGSMQQIPSLVGLVVPKLFGRQRWAGGFSLTRVNAWNQSMNAQRQVTVGATDERLEYSSTSGLSGIQANLGVGYTNGQKLGIGGSIDIQAAGYRIEFHSEGTAEIDADREALGRALRNLLENAVKYSPDHRTVEVGVTSRDATVSISVRDHGIGVPAGERKAIFNRFERGAEARTRGIKGTGLGLAMVDHIVRAHRGRARVESAPGEGSRFTIELPVRT